MDQEQLTRFDREGYTVIEVISRSPRVSTNAGTLASPSTFVGIDGRVYWVKARSQQGLVAELICGRLASLVGAGPAARIIRVTPEAMGSLTPGKEAYEQEMIGIVVGSEDQDGDENARDLAQFIAGGTFRPDLLDAASRARVTAFQSWVGAGDVQVLVSLTTGRVSSIDHGECFGQLDKSAPSIITVNIPNVGSDVGRASQYLRPAIDRIEKVTDQQLLRASASIPGGAQWRSPTDRRLQIAEWLANRRGLLQEAFLPWL